MLLPLGVFNDFILHTSFSIYNLKKIDSLLFSFLLI